MTGIWFVKGRTLSPPSATWLPRCPCVAVFTRGAAGTRYRNREEKLCCSCGFRDMASAKGYTWDGGNWRVRRGSLGGWRRISC